DKLEQLITGLSGERDPIGTAITSLDNGTASLASLLGEARQPLAGAVEQANRLAPLLYDSKDGLEAGIKRMPGNYRKLQRLGAYGSFIQYYICGLSFRASDLQGRTVVFPWIKQETGRCTEP
ncbi:MAG TPA: mammalian cell entry protein, partial [Mycobacterium sp.]|nr:mammalian cell entry protein [Mycobacterium sp.]